MTNKVYFHGSVYVLLLFVLIHRDWKDSIFVFANNTVPESVIRFFKDNKVKYWLLNEKSNGNILKQIENRIRLYHEVIKLKQLNNTTYYGSDNGDIAKFFIGSRFVAIEDGTVNYQGKMEIARLVDNNSLIYIPKKYLPYGYDSVITNIYLTGMFKVPDELKSKSTIVNIIELWKKKTEIEKCEIMQMFGIDICVMNKYRRIRNVVLTQPFEYSRDITEMDKISIYKRILSNYDAKDTLIKPHPRESTDYSAVFPHHLVVKEKFPIELLCLMCDNLVHIITITSTGAFSVAGGADVDLYDSNGVYKTTVNRGCDIDKVFYNVSEEQANYRFSRLQKLVFGLEGYVAQLMMDRN